MITRATKHIFRSYLAEVEEFQLASAVAHLLSSLLSSNDAATSDEKGKHSICILLQALMNILSSIYFQ
jgi:hypothetical protein